MTKYVDRNKFRKEDTPIVLDNSWTRDVNKIPMCSFCRRDLIKLTQKNGLSPSWICSFCQVETLEEDTDNLRSKSKLKLPDGPIEEPASSVVPEPQLRRKKNEPKGTFKALQDRGIKIHNYQERGWRKTTYE